MLAYVYVQSSFPELDTPILVSLIHSSVPNCRAHVPERTCLHNKEQTNWKVFHGPESMRPVAFNDCARTLPGVVLLPIS